MIAPLVPAKLAESFPAIGKKRRVLLIDRSSRKRELRAEVMRKLGIEVDSAADIAEARCWWKAELYDLVLINVENNRGSRDNFCDDLRAAAPRQQFAFLVGGPEYLAHSPGPDPAVQDESEDARVADVAAAIAADVGDLGQRWGFVEASRRISAVRAASNARTQAMRNLPGPARDLETRQPKYSAGPARSLDDLLRREEME